MIDKKAHEVFAFASDLRKHKPVRSTKRGNRLFEEKQTMIDKILELIKTSKNIGANEVTLTIDQATELLNVITDAAARMQKASELLEPLKTRIFEQHNETIDEVVERVKGLFSPDDEVIKEIDEISQELKIQC